MLTMQEHEFFDTDRTIDGSPSGAPRANYVDPARELDETELLAFRAAAGIRSHIGARPRVPVFNIGLDPANSITTTSGEVPVGVETLYTTYRRGKPSGR